MDRKGERLVYPRGHEAGINAASSQHQTVPACIAIAPDRRTSRGLLAGVEACVPCVRPVLSLKKVMACCNCSA